MKAYSPNLIPSLLDLMTDLGPLTLKKELGRVGFFFKDRLFGLVSGGKFWMRTDPEICPLSGKPLPPTIQMLAESGQHFIPVPDEVLDDQNTFHQWAEWAITS